MTRPPSKSPCPHCRDMVSTTATRCPSCGQTLYEAEEDYYPPVRDVRRKDEVEAVDFLVPTNVSGWAMASCYLGLIGFCLPLIGMPLAALAVLFGIIALRRRSQSGSYGAVTSNVRAIIGLVLGSLGVLGWGALLILMAATGGFK